MRVAGAALLVAGIVLAANCSAKGASSVAVPNHEGATKSAAAQRAERRAYDGAPPTVPHKELGAACMECHNERGLHVEGLGFAPPSPHEITPGLSAKSRCRQCHVQVQVEELFVPTSFRGLAQNLRRGSRQHPLAPPRMAHAPFMRENCVACHSGAAAREGIRSPHPERERCRQCHLPVITQSPFSR